MSKLKLSLLFLLVLPVLAFGEEPQKFKCVAIAPENYPLVFRCENDEMICYIYDSQDGLKCEFKHE